MEFVVSPENYSQIERTLPTSGGNPAPGSAATVPHRLDHAQTDPETVARLEWLDDLMFSAINGDPTYLEMAADAWKNSLQELGSATLEESRRQYLRCAQSVWNDLRNEPNHPPDKVFAAIEVISLLVGKAW